MARRTPICFIEVFFSPNSARFILYGSGQTRPIWKRSLNTSGGWERLRPRAPCLRRFAPHSERMCGRYETDLRALPGLSRFTEWVGPEIVDEIAKVRSLDVRPTHTMPILLRPEREAPWEVEPMRWGLLPHWAQKKDLKPAINARAETVAEKPYFRKAFAERRAVVVASAFFEWRPPREGEKKKRKMRIARADGLPIFLAAIWEPAPEVSTYAILTTDAGPDVVDVHDRQPVVLEIDALETWTLCGGDELLRPSDEGSLLLEEA